MATAAVLPMPVFGDSTKGLNFDDPIAKLIQNEFVDRVVNPKSMMLYLPHDTLTESDEDRVATVQDSYGREAAARLLLSLITQRDDWIPRLQQGLRYREVRLEDLADRLDKLQAQVPMQIDFDDDTLMEVDSEPFSPPDDMNPTLKDILDGSEPRNLNVQQRKVYIDSVLAEIAHQFFATQFIRSVEEVERLTKCYERITSAILKQFAIGCLELLLAFDTSDELKEFRRLMESGILQEALEHALLPQTKRDWLTAEAASYGLIWRQVQLKITVRIYDLQRCETYLKLKEEKTYPKSHAEAFLLRMAAKPEANISQRDVQELPGLLISFLNWLLKEHPNLADKVATHLVTARLNIALPQAMHTCRQYFGLANEYEGDIANVLSEMLATMPATLMGAGFSDVLEEASDQGLAEEGAEPQLLIEPGPDTQLAATVEKLTQAKIMKPHDVPDKKNAFIFSTSFVEDFAFTCVSDFASRHLPSLSYFPPFHVSNALRRRSSFAILHFLDLILSPSLHEAPSLSRPGQQIDRRFTRNISKRAKRIEEVTIIISKLSEELVESVSKDGLSVDVAEMLLACYKLFPTEIDITPIFQRRWVTFGPEWKKMARDLLASGSPGALPEILLCNFVIGLTATDKPSFLERAEHVLSFKHTIDLTKLTELGIAAFEAVLGCAQLSDVGKFEPIIDIFAKLKHIPESEGYVERSKIKFGQPALKFCYNTMDDKHVELLLKALPGLQSLPHLDLTGCILSQQNLQHILNHLPVNSMRTLILSKVAIRGFRSTKFVPKFSHLKRLQSLDLGSLALQDKQMSEVAQQLTALHDLRELTLENNPITTAGLSQLTPALASLGSLRVLRLAHCQLDAGAAYVLGAMLVSCCSLQVLNLSHCCLQDSGLQHLSLTMKNHTQLAKVSLRNGDYSPQGLASFLTHLSRCNHLQHLEIGRCPLEADGYDISDKLIKTLAASSLWDSLGLWHCRIGHTNLLKNIQTLDIQLRGLTKLVLQDNDLGQASIEDLAAAIQRGIFRYLRHINLRQNNIQSHGAECLAQALLFLPRLKELLLQNSAIPSSAALSLARVVLHLPDMQHLELTDSDAMNHQDYLDIIMEIRRIVQEGHEMVGTGVKYADNDQLLECKFALENARRLSGKEHPVSIETKEKDLCLKQIEEHLQLLEKGEQLVSEEEQAEMIEVPHFRQIAEQKGNGVVIDGVLYITLGHT